MTSQQVLVMLPSFDLPLVAVLEVELVPEQLILV